MGAPCMALRTNCVVAGKELHGALGILTPPGVPYTPSKETVWISLCSTYYGAGDDPVWTVVICGEPAVKKGADSKYRRMHHSVVGVLPPNVIVTPISDMGLIVLNVAFGNSHPIWGSSSVLAARDPVAVIGVPYSPAAPCNQMICSDPCDVPLGDGLQMPSTVFIGMSGSDYARCAAEAAVDMAKSFVLNAIAGYKNFFAGLGGLFSKQIEKAMGKAVEKEIAKKLEEEAEKEAEKVLTNKLLHEAAKQGAEKTLGKKAVRGLTKEAQKAAAKKAFEDTGREAGKKALDEAKGDACKELGKRTADKLIGDPAKEKLFPKKEEPDDGKSLRSKAWSTTKELLFGKHEKHPGESE